MKKYLLAILLLIAGITSAFAQQRAAFSEKIMLGDGEMFNSFSYSDEKFAAYHEKEEEMAAQLAHKLKTSSYLRAFDLFSDEGYIEDVLEGVYDSFYICSLDNVLPSIYSVFREITGKQAVRDYLFKIGCEALCDLCKLYPKDFKSNLLKQIAYMDEVVKELSKHTYVQDKTRSDLYIDGELNNELAHEFEGYILRRNLNDNISWNEMHQKLVSLKNAIEGVDVTRNPEVMGHVSINNEATYKVTANGDYYIVGKSMRLTPYDKEKFVGCTYWMSEETCLKCLKDMNETVYIIYRGDDDSSDTSIIVDSKGKVLSGADD